MPKKMGFASQSILLLASFVFLFFWQESGLSQFSAQLIGLLVFVYIIISAGFKKRFALGGPLGVFILNTVIFLVIFSTGGLSSSFFFVLYFVIFGMAFVFEPHLAFVFAAGSLIVFLPIVTQGNVIENFVKIASLFLISPLAYFFGNMFRKQEKNDDEVVQVKERAQDAADSIASDVETVLTNEQEKLKSQDVEKLNDILEETEILREEGKK